MLPIPFISTETLASCAEIGQTRAAKTSAGNTMRQIRVSHSPKILCLVGPAIALLQRLLRVQAMQLDLRHTGAWAGEWLIVTRYASWEVYGRG